MTARRYVCVAFFSLALGALTYGQDAPSNSQTSGDSDGSVAAAARGAKAQKNAHAKKVFTDEDMDAGPLPRLKMEGPENSQEVADAAGKYKLTHTPQQTEQVLRAWYDRYDQILAGAIQSNLNMKSLHQGNVSAIDDFCQQTDDYQECQKRKVSELSGQRYDAGQLAKNNALIVRIQHAFFELRNGLTRNGLHYEWFKVRGTNGIDSI
jgi:hypothetical protein